MLKRNAIKLLLVTLLLFSIMGCMNNSGSEDLKTEISMTRPKEITNEEFFSDRRAILSSAFIYGFYDSEGIWKTAENVDLMDDWGRVWVGVAGNAPGSVSFAYINASALGNDLHYDGEQTLSDQFGNIWYMNYYYIDTADLRKRFVPIINYPFYVRYSNGATFREDTKTVSLKPYYVY